MTPSTVIGTAVATGTVQLSTPASTDTVVSLSSSNPAVQVAQGVVVASGTDHADFSIQTSAVIATVTTTISAALNGMTLTQPLTVRPIGVASITVDPTTVLGGYENATATVHLQAPAAPGAITVSLTSSNAAATIPSSVVIPAGQDQVTVPVTTHFVAMTTTVTLKATANQLSASTPLQVRAPGVVSIEIAPTTVLGGVENATETVHLEKPAPAAGIKVALSSSNTGAATVPSSVIVPPGSDQVTVPITSKAVTAGAAVTIKATANSMTASAPLTVRTPVIIGLTVLPSTALGGADMPVATVQLERASTMKVTVKLTSSYTGAASVPSTVYVPAGQASVNLTVTTKVVSADASVTLTGTAGGASATADLLVRKGLKTSLSVGFLPAQSRYPRGTVITLQAILKDATGHVMAGKPVRLVQYVQSQGVRTALATLTTDGLGKVQLPGYVVPTDPNMDYVYIEAYFDYDETHLSSKASTRIPIGL